MWEKFWIDNHHLHHNHLHWRMTNDEIEIYRRPLTPHQPNTRSFVYYIIIIIIIILPYYRHNIILFDESVKQNNMEQVLTVCSCATPSPCHRLRSDKSCRTWRTRNCRPGSRFDPFLWGSNRQRQAVHPRVTWWPTPVGIYHLKRKISVFKHVYSGSLTRSRDFINFVICFSTSEFPKVIIIRPTIYLPAL